MKKVFITSGPGDLAPILKDIMPQFYIKIVYS